MVKLSMTDTDMLAEMRDLFAELQAATNRAQIRAEFIALSAAAARAQRVMTALEQNVRV